MSSASRPYIDKAHPQVYQAMIKAAAQSREASKSAGLDPSVIELVNVRVSQINRCPTCLSIHSPAARRAGITQRQLDVLPAWRDNDAFDDVQRAALGIAEAITVLPGGDAVAEAVSKASEHLSTEQIAAVEWTAILINSFNRISIGSGHPLTPERSDAAKDHSGVA